MSTPVSMNAVEKLAVMLQDAKTFMEKNGAPSPSGFDGKPALRRIYRALSSTIYDLEELASVDAPALRDARDAAALDGSWAEPRPEPERSPLCQCTDPECPHCGGECDLLPMYHLVRVDTDVLPSKQAKVQMCEVCGEDALKSGPFALDHTVGCSD